MSKIIITVECGCVSGVFATDKNVEVLIVDHDADGADPDEIFSDQEIKEFVGNEKFIEIDSRSGIMDNKKFHPIDNWNK